MLNITTLAVLLVILGEYTHALSLRTVSDKKLIKRDTDGDFYPDWVPFKNKKGDQLGEFIQVKKKKPAKRLALPVNFVLRPVAEGEGDDYYEKGQGETDGVDYYEKKEWSDEYRMAKQGPAKVIKNSTEGSDIEGIVNIIITDKRPTTQTEPSTTTEPDSLAVSVEENKLPKKLTQDVSQTDTNKGDSEVKTIESMVKDKEERQENSKDESEVGLLLPIEYQEGNKETTVEDITDPKPSKKPREYNDYEEESAEKEKPEQTEEEKQEAEAKKQRILSLVDDLKRRHEKEQREISERAKEDEIIKEERDRELSRGRIILHSNEADDGYDKYNSRNYNKDRPKHYYDDYEEANLGDKYQIHPPTKKRLPTTTIAPVTSTVSNINVRTPKNKRTKPTSNKHKESGKLSVFKNPRLYMMYDDDDVPRETSTAKTPKKTSRKTYRTYPTSSSTSPYTTPALLTSNDSNESVRISLVPEDDEMKDGEPTLFFPQKRKNKRRRKNRTRSSTPEPDSFVAESVNGFAKDIVNNDTTEFPALRSTLETKAVLSSSEESTLSSPTAPAASGEIFIETRESPALAAVPSSAVSDAEASATGHVEPKHDNYDREKGKFCISFFDQ